jgi:hypothetical protein
VGQSALLPEMFFAWDSRLERLTTEAVRRYYRDRYGLSERELADTRSIVGLLRRAGRRNVKSANFNCRAGVSAETCGRSLPSRGDFSQYLGRTSAAVPDRRGLR